MTTAVTAVTGIGPKTAEYLQQQGIDTVEKLLAGGVALLSGAPGFGEARARTVIQAAGEMAGAGAGKAPESGKDSGKKKKKKKDKQGKKEAGAKDKGKKDKGKGKKKKDKGKKKKKKK